MAALDDLPAGDHVPDVVLVGKRDERAAKKARGGPATRRRKKRAATEAREQGSEMTDATYLDDLGELLEADAEALRDVEAMLQGLGLEEAEGGGEEGEDEEEEEESRARTRAVPQHGPAERAPPARAERAAAPPEPDEPKPSPEKERPPGEVEGAEYLY